MPVFSFWKIIYTDCILEKEKDYYTIEVFDFEFEFALAFEKIVNISAAVMIQRLPLIHQRNFITIRIDSHARNIT